MQVEVGSPGQTGPRAHPPATGIRGAPDSRHLYEGPVPIFQMGTSVFRAEPAARALDRLSLCPARTTFPSAPSPAPRPTGVWPRSSPPPRLCHAVLPTCTPSLPSLCFVDLPSFPGMDQCPVLRDTESLTSPARAGLVGWDCSRTVRPQTLNSQGPLSRAQEAGPGTAHTHLHPEPAIHAAGSVPWWGPQKCPWLAGIVANTE